MAGMPAGSIDLIITSPPYYGMRTYIPDQWLRHWFLGGSSEVEYSMEGQLDHRSPECFVEGLRQVWVNVANVAAPGARMVIRFGGIADRKANPQTLLKESLRGTPWVLRTVRPAAP